MIRVVEPPASEPVTIMAAKFHLREVDHGQDSLISTMLRAAREDREQHTGRLFVTQTAEMVLDGFPSGGRPIEFGVGPVQEVESVTYIDQGGEEQEIEEADLVFVPEGGVYPARISPASGSWPSVRGGRPGAVTVRFIAGYGEPEDVPAPIIASILLVLGDLFENREAGVVGSITAQNPTANSLVRPYRFGVGVA